MNFTYEKAVDYLYGIPKFTTKNGLEHTRELIRRLGVDEQQFQIIHVAGSNGKGSVCSAVNTVLVEAKKHTGMFVSPHLVKVEERFCIDGVPCSQEQFLDSFVEVYRVVEQMKREGLAHPSFFEYLFGMAMYLFEKERVEYVVLETGLGGRLDCTNIIKKPLVTVITSLSLEHTQYLGESIEEIAYEKAGIIKEGVPVVYDASNEAAKKVICQKARKKNAQTYEVSPKSLNFIEFNGKNIDFYYCCGYDGNTRISIPFAAPYQMMNMAVAYQTMRVTEQVTGISKEEILLAIAHTKWQGRMQEIEEEVYLDGAHNASGVEEFLHAVRWMNARNPILLFSMVEDKDYEEAIRQLAAENWERIYVTEIADVRGMKAHRLAEIFKKYGQEAIPIADSREAYCEARRVKRQGQNLFCTGSLYFIGELLSFAGGKKHD